MSGDTTDAPKKSTLSATVDGTAIEANPGELLIAAAERHGVYIPRFCWHPRMREVGMCRMCLIEVDGPRGPALQPACMLPVTEGMVVHTQSATVKKAQDGVLEFLLINHPLDCPVCDKGGECPLQDQTLTFGPGETRFVEEKRHFEKPIAISDLVNLDRERCILCDRCTRFSKEVSGDPLIHFVNRGNRTEVNTFPDDPYASYFSGNVVQICPVGALTARPYRFAARPWDLDQVESTCTSCALGCRVVVQSSGDRIIRKQGVDSEPVNWGWLCDKGRFDYEAIVSPDRFTHPMLRSAKGSAPAPASWHDALAKVAEALRSAGPQGVGFIGGARLTNEDQYAWAKLAKGMLGTDNVDAQLGDGLPAELWLGLPRATIADACDASAVLLLGPDVKEELPVLFLRLRDAALNRGVPLFEVAPMVSGLAKVARAALHYRPGELAVLVRALLDAASGSKVAEHSVGGVDAEVVNAAGEALAAAMQSGKGNGKLVVVLGRANLADGSATVVEAAQVLAAAAGLGEVSFLPAMRRSNLHGALDMGLTPGLLPGRVRLADGAPWFNAHGWSRMPLSPGLDTTAMLRAAAAGEIKTLVLIGADPIADHPDRALAEQALARVETLVAIDTLPNASNALASVVLPAAGYGEKAGTTTSTEGRVTTLATKTSAPGVARADWMIAAELALHLDADLGVDSVWHLTDEIARLAPSHAGLGAEVLARHGDGLLAGAAAAPVGPGAPGAGEPEESGPAAVALGDGGADGPAGESPTSDPEPDAVPAGPSRPATLTLERPGAVEAVPVPQPDAYSLRLVVGRRLYDNGTIVQASPALAKLAPAVALHLHPGEVERHGLRVGGAVRVTAANGASAVLPVVADEQVARGTAFVPFNRPGEVHAGQLIDSSTTEAATKVRLESVGATADGGDK